MKEFSKVSKLVVLLFCGMTFFTGCGSKEPNSSRKSEDTVVSPEQSRAELTKTVNPPPTGQPVHEFIDFNGLTSPFHERRFGEILLKLGPRDGPFWKRYTFSSDRKPTVSWPEGTLLSRKDASGFTYITIDQEIPIIVERLGTNGAYSALDVFYQRSKSPALQRRAQNIVLDGATDIPSQISGSEAVSTQRSLFTNLFTTIAKLKFEVSSQQSGLVQQNVKKTTETNLLARLFSDCALYPSWQPDPRPVFTPRTPAEYYTFGWDDVAQFLYLPTEAFLVVLRRSPMLPERNLFQEAVSSAQQNGTIDSQIDLGEVDSWPTDESYVAAALPFRKADQASIARLISARNSFKMADSPLVQKQNFENQTIEVGVNLILNHATALWPKTEKVVEVRFSESQTKGLYFSVEATNAGVFPWPYEGKLHQSGTADWDGRSMKIDSVSEFSNNLPAEAANQIKTAKAYARFAASWNGRTVHLVFSGKQKAFAITDWGGKSFGCLFEVDESPDGNIRLTGIEISGEPVPERTGVDLKFIAEGSDLVLDKENGPKFKKI